MNLDILVIAAHPDDAELCCAGTVASHINKGRKVGIVDLTMGEMGTRGDAQTRLKEAEAAAGILNLTVRENLGFKDYFFKNDEEHQTEIVKRIRHFKPEIILTNAITDRHPDHGKAARLVSDAVFLSGLIKFETKYNGEKQEAHRPRNVYHFIQNNYIEPDVVVDISGYWNIKQKAIAAFSSQFYNPESDEPDSFISSKEFFHFIEARAREFGHRIGAEYGEGFTVDRNIGVQNLFDLI